MSRMTEQIGRVLGGRYRLLSPLGSGASAQVYLADDVRLRRQVAVKILHPALAADESFLRRFRAEAQSAASLSHPHLGARRAPPPPPLAPGGCPGAPPGVLFRPGPRFCTCYPQPAQPAGGRG